MENNIKLYTCDENTMLLEAMKRIDENEKGILYIVSEKRKLLGSATDGDIRRWVIKTGVLEAPIYKYMNTSPYCIFENDRTAALQKMKEWGITSLPVLNSARQVVDIIFFNEGGEVNETSVVPSNDINVIIMAGGRGTRLYPYTKILPKPLIPIGDIPILERIINRFGEYGIFNFFLTVNYKKEMIKAYFAETKMKYNITYIEEEKPLGTAGSIRLIEDRFDSPVIIINCDTLIEVNYLRLMEYHKTSGNVLTIVSAIKNMTVPYGVIHSTEQGIVTSMEEKPSMSYFINTGLYILNPELIEKIPMNTFFHMTDLTVLLMKEGYQVGMYPISEDSFLDMGEFEEMRRMEKKLNGE